MFHLWTQLHVASITENQIIHRIITHFKSSIPFCKRISISNDDKKFVARHAQVSKHPPLHQRSTKWQMWYQQIGTIKHFFHNPDSTHKYVFTLSTRWLTCLTGFPYFFNFPKLTCALFYILQLVLFEHSQLLDFYPLPPLQIGSFQLCSTNGSITYRCWIFSVQKEKQKS